VISAVKYALQDNKNEINFLSDLTYRPKSQDVELQVF